MRCLAATASEYFELSHSALYSLSLSGKSWDILSAGVKKLGSQ